jgi:hypothetical protein
MTAEPLPDAVDALPRCPVWDLPVPFSSGTDPDTGAGKFGRNDLIAKMLCGLRGLCGVCGLALGDGEVVFITVDTGATWTTLPAFNDPPNHPACAEASMRLCPYIARPRHPGRDGAPKPGWLMWVCRSFEFVPGQTSLAVFAPGPITQVRRFTYDGADLTEVSR